MNAVDCDVGFLGEEGISNTRRYQSRLLAQGTAARGLLVCFPPCCCRKKGQPSSVCPASPARLRSFSSPRFNLKLQFQCLHSVLLTKLVTFEVAGNYYFFTQQRDRFSRMSVFIDLCVPLFSEHTVPAMSWSLFCTLGTYVQEDRRGPCFHGAYHVAERDRQLVGGALMKV